MTQTASTSVVSKPSFLEAQGAQLSPRETVENLRFRDDQSLHSDFLLTDHSLVQIEQPEEPKKPAVMTCVVRLGFSEPDVAIAPLSLR